MKTVNSKLGVFLLLLLTVVIGAFSSNALAQVSIDQLQVQGYLQQSTGGAVNNSPNTGCFGGGSAGYGIAFVLEDSAGGTALWGTKQCVTVANGLFGVTLTSTGANLTGVTGLSHGATDWSAVTLSTALLAAGTGELSIEVYAIDAVNNLHPDFNIPITAVPTAMLAQEALTVINNSINFASLNTSGVYVNVGGTANRLVETNSTTGQIDQTFLPGGTSGLPVNGGGTGATSLLQNGVVIGNGTNPMTTTAVGGAGTVLHGTGAAPSFSAVGLTTDVTGTLPVANGGTGLASAGAPGNVIYNNAGTPAWDTPTNAGVANISGGNNTNITNFTGLGVASAIVKGNGAGGITSAVAGTDYDPAAGSTSVTTLGTITTGTWNGTTIAAANGGTGLATYTTGAIPVATGTTTLSALPIGATGQVLTVSGGAPVWAANAATSAPNRTALYMWEDFMSTTTAAITAAATYMTGTALLWSTGATTLGNVNAGVNTPFHLGVLNINSGSTAAKNVGVGFCAGTYTAGTVVANDNFATTDNWTFTASVALSAVANTGSTWIGMLSTFPTTLVTNNANAGTFFEVLNATIGNVNAWSRNTATIGGNISTYTTGTFQNYTISYTGSSTTINMFINGTLMATTAAAASIPSGTNLCPSIQRASDTVGSGMLVDYIGFTQQTTVANGDR